MQRGDITPEQLVENVSGLITLPDVYLRINRLIEDPKSTSEDLSRAISQDASFTIKLLKLANSSAYGLPTQVDTVAKAVTLIGTSQIRSLALSLSVGNSFKDLPNDLVSMQDFWRHSLLCALTARHLCKLARRCDADSLFTAGLLHDIGELLIFNRLPDQARQALTTVVDNQEEIEVPEAEADILGFDHSDVGAVLARHWNLPEVLQACIAWHHKPSAAKQHAREVAFVHIANSLAQLAEIGSLDPEDAPAIEPEAWQAIGLSPDVIEPVVHGIQQELGEIEQLFLGA